MKNLYIIPALLISLSGLIFAQDAAEEVVEISTVEALLALVKEGKTKEQAANTERENKFVANKNKQASILAAEKRELARQEKIADTLEAEYKKNEGSCYDLEAFEQIIDNSRNPEDLLMAWNGWHEIGKPMKPMYMRMVEIGNQGSRDLGYSGLDDLLPTAGSIVILNI